ncbi:hypothetical protein HHUSO_G31908 [Huso huso]|uniref:Uncharacterized protein n=1 Tax=Huso huso TaxID=61971 RepID=A0ABR0YAZ9_HUSHU
MILPLTIPVAFFILCAASAVESTFLVHQSPAILRAAEGTRVILNCTFQSAGTLPSVGQASWWRGRVRKACSSPTATGRSRAECSLASSSYS